MTFSKFYPEVFNADNLILSFRVQFAGARANFIWVTLFHMVSGAFQLEQIYLMFEIGTRLFRHYAHEPESLPLIAKFSGWQNQHTHAHAVAVTSSVLKRIGINGAVVVLVVPIAGGGGVDHKCFMRVSACTDGQRETVIAKSIHNTSWRGRSCIYYRSSSSVKYVSGIALKSIE